MIRLPADNNDSAIGDHVKSMLQTIDPNIHINSIEFVGPNVGEELAQRCCLCDPCDFGNDVNLRWLTF